MSIIPNNLTLYSLIWGFQDIKINSLIHPRIPENTLSTEDKTIPRICTSQSLDGCLTGIGPSHIGLNACKDLITQDKDKKLEVLDPHSILLPFTVIKFNVDRNSPDVLLPGKVINYGVEDAFYSGEIWLTSPVKPCEVSYKWLIDGDIEKTYLLHNGLKQNYFTVSNSQWSDTKKAPNKLFIEDIFYVTKQWIIQEGWVSEKTKSTDSRLNYNSLDAKINSAENKKATINSKIHLSKTNEHVK